MQFNASNILSTLALLGAGTVAWSDSQSKIANAQVEIHNLKEADKRIEAAAHLTKEDIIKRLDEIKADVREIRNQQRK